MKLLIHELAKRASVTVRTLHYCDSIGLLVPHEIKDNGYRYYDEENVERLKHILYFKELGFSLQSITHVLDREDQKNELLMNQRYLLQLKKERIEKMIKAIDDAINGELTMNFEEFDMQTIEKATQSYKEEVETKWGKSKEYIQSRKKTSQYSQEEWKQIKEEEGSLLSKFSQILEHSPSSVQALQLVEKWQSYISKNFYDCSDTMLENLGELYKDDDRFKDSMDRFKEGTALFMYKAIKEYVNQNHE